jgi:hypothetical protein
VLGIGCAFFIVPGLVDIAQTNWRNIFKKESSVTTTDMQKEISERDVPSDYSRPSLRI